MKPRGVRYGWTRVIMGPRHRGCVLFIPLAFPLHPIRGLHLIGIPQALAELKVRSPELSNPSFRDPRLRV